MKVVEVADLNDMTKKFQDLIGNLKNEIEEKNQEAIKYKDQK